MARDPILVKKNKVIEIYAWIQFGFSPRFTTANISEF